MNAVKTMLNKLFKSINPKSFSRQNTKKEDDPVFITLEEARRDPVLINKIHSQSNTAKLTIGSSNKYFAGVKHKNHQYYILGTLQEWSSLFGMRTEKRSSLKFQKQNIK